MVGVVFLVFPARASELAIFQRPPHVNQSARVHGLSAEAMYGETANKLVSSSPGPRAYRKKKLCSPGEQ